MLTIIKALSTLWHDSTLGRLEHSNTNESHRNFVRSVVGVRKARRFAANGRPREPNGRLSFTPACHSDSVITRSASRRRCTTCDPVSSTATLSRLAPVDTRKGRVGARGNGDKRGLTYLRPAIINEVMATTCTETEQGSSKDSLSSKRDSLGSAQSLPETVFVQQEMVLVHKKKLCSKCGKNEVYLNIETLDWCEPCIWRFVQC